MSGRSMKAGVLATTVGVALLLATAAAIAEAPERDRRGGPDGQQHGPQRGESEGRRRGRGLLAAPDVDVSITQNDDGVTLLVTSDKPELAERIRERLPQHLERMRQRHTARTGEGGVDHSDAANRMRGKRGARTGGPLGPRSRFGREDRRPSDGQRFNAFVDAKADVEFVQKDRGVAIILTSDDSEVAAQIKETVPRQIEMMKTFRERGHERWQRRVRGGEQEHRRRGDREGYGERDEDEDEREEAGLRRMIRQEIRRALREMKEEGGERGHERWQRRVRGGEQEHRRRGDREGYGERDEDEDELEEAELRRMIRQEIRRALREMDERRGR